jgi:hypothetical protein
LEPELNDLLDRLDTIDRGTPGWVNLADAFITRVRASGTGAPSGEIEVANDQIILRDLSPTASDAFQYAVSQCETFGMEFVGPIIGYPDEAEEILEIVQSALQTWRGEKDGEAAPPGIEADEGDEVPEGAEAAT